MLKSVAICSHKALDDSMSKIRATQRPNPMDVIIRPLKRADIPQSEDIERESFPTLFSPTSFRRDLTNPRSFYLVACRRAQVPPNPLLVEPHPAIEPNTWTNPSFMETLIQRALNAWGKQWQKVNTDHEFVIGFIGTWQVVNEAHIVSLGVRSMLRQRGIGELLLISAVELAMARRANFVTLEVRRSNEAARNLYRKYGFKERGIRKNYYTRDREDAIIMTTDPILLPPYIGMFNELKWAHMHRWGEAEREAV